uniref:Putative group i salivary lipocalin n=1 Tax=Rhipicephalus pulchellus TaxID=72859 RepID=L7LTN0_RHIPC
MAGRWRAAMFILVVFCATVSGAPYPGGGNVNHQYNFVQFFNPPELIWTYRSSWNGDFTCERAIMKNISGRTVELETKFTLNKKKYKHTAKGTLYNVWGQNSPLNRMTMRDYWQDTLNKEIVYASSDYKCAVLYVERYHGWPPVTFDLLVKKSQLDNGPSADCMDKYNEEISARRIGDTNRTVYTPECRKRKNASNVHQLAH